MSRNYYSPHPEDEVARRMSNVDRKIERIIRMPPTSPAEVTDELAALDGHVHGLADHTHDLLTYTSITYNATGNITHINGVAISGGGTFQVAAIAPTDGPNPTDSDPWDAP